MAKAAVISIGTELTGGRVVDTNASHISRHLYTAGFSIVEHAVVPDNSEKILSTVSRLLKEADIIVITGGLGPTSDDVTVKAVADFFKRDIVADPVAREKIEFFFRQTGRDVNESDLRMAEIPEGAEVLSNPAGLAPGFLIQENNKMIFVLPGVPREMKSIFEDSVLPRMKKNHSQLNLSCTFRFFGLKESAVDDFLAAHDHAEKCSWGITVEGGTITAVIQAAEKEYLDKIHRDLKKEFDNFMLLGQNMSPNEELVSLLLQKEMSVCSAESCTGGLVGKLLTDIPGASCVYRGSVIAYDNRIKQSLLDVPGSLIDEKGSVSEEVALIMARNCAALMGTDAAVSTSGVAGPGGGSEEKPVGTVCFGVKLMDKEWAFTCIFPGDRYQVRYRSAITAIDTLRILLRNNEKNC